MNHDFVQHDADDGIDGPVGHSFGAALAAVASEKGFVASFPAALDVFVRQPWRGRELTIRWSSIGARARTTGYRWIAIRLTTSRLGVWANPPKVLQTDSVEGADIPLGPPPGSPTGFYAQDPRLLEAMWGFVARALPAGAPTDHETVACWLRLHARNDAVIWHVRAQRITPALLSEALDLLAWFATYGERFDAYLSSRGPSPSVTRARNFQLVAAVVVLCVTLGVCVLVAVIAALTR